MFLETPVIYDPGKLPGKLPGNLREVMTSRKVPVKFTGSNILLQENKMAAGGGHFCPGLSVAYLPRAIDFRQNRRKRNNRKILVIQGSNKFAC